MEKNTICTKINIKVINRDKWKYNNDIENKRKIHKI